MHSAVVERLGLEAELKAGLARDELLLHFQPIVDLDSEDIVKLEALVRREHPERGVVPPSHPTGRRRASA
jgi:Amt family ammonium transporter